MGMGFKHTILQRVQNYEIMCTEKMKNLNKKTSDQPIQVTDFSISRILSEENKINKIKNLPTNEKIYTKSKSFSSGNSDILDLSKHASSIYHNADSPAQHLAASPFTNYNTGLGPMDFLMATKFYAQFIPHMIPQNYNLPRNNGNQHYGFPSGAALPITTHNNTTLPMHVGSHAFQTPKSQRVFAPYIINSNKMDFYVQRPKGSEEPSSHSTIPTYSKGPAGKPSCNRVNCSECLREYYQQITLKIPPSTNLLVSPTHNAIKLTNETDTQSKNSSGIVEETTCSTGNYATSDNNSQMLKLTSVVNKSMTASSLEEVSYKCFICDKVFGCSQTLQAHEKTHKSPRYECSDCGKGFSQLRNYKYHLSVHRGTKEFAAECPECGKTFNDKGYLSSHMKIHRNKKEYECPYCPKSFNQRVAFNMHVRIHTGVKPHKCTECGKRFSRKMLLKQHMRTHSGEKPYQCSVCGKSFADRSNMTLHHRLHSGIKPFNCPICPKAFTKKHHLKTHLNYHTGCKPYVCPHANCNQAFTQSSNMRTHAKKCQYRPLQMPTHPVIVVGTNSTSTSSTCASTTTIIKNINCNNINTSNNYLTTPTVTNATALHFGMSTSALITKPTTTTLTTIVPHNNMGRLSSAMPTSSTPILYPVAALPAPRSAHALPFPALHPHFHSKSHCFTKSNCK